MLSKEKYDRKMKNLHVRSALRVKKAVLRLNGLFIKVGQMISSMGTLLPEAFMEHLQELQDHAPQTPFEKIAVRIADELGQAPESLFAQFDRIPVASASIAQVHKAQLLSGEWVAVKVKHAHIDRIAPTDLAIIRKLTKVGAWFLKMDGMEYMHSQISEMIYKELDFTNERQAQLHLKSLLRKERGLIIPDVHGDFTSKSIFTSTWFDGVKVNDVPQLEAWHLDPTDIAKRIIRSYCVMLFKHGYYHADPHPGNILVAQDGTLALLDFGAVGQVQTGLREGIPVMITAAFDNDIDTLIRKGQEIGFIATGEEAEQNARKLMSAMRTFFMEELSLTQLNFDQIDIDPFNNSMVLLVREMGVRNLTKTMRIPKDWVLLNRAVTLIVGLSATLDPNLNPLDVVRPYLKRHLMFKEKRTTIHVAGAVIRERWLKVRKQLSRSATEFALEARSAAASVASGLIVMAKYLFP